MDQDDTGAKPLPVKEFKAVYTHTGHATQDAQAFLVHAQQFALHMATFSRSVPADQHHLYFSTVFLSSLADGPGQSAVLSFKHEYFSNPVKPKIDDLTALATVRFAAEVRPHSDVARDKLFTRSYRMTGSTTIGAYISGFQSLMGRIPNMSEADCIRWFQEGLSTELQPECLLDLEGDEFTDIAALYKHATQEARRLAVKAAHAARTQQPFNNRFFHRRPKLSVAAIDRPQARKRSLEATTAAASAPAKRPANGWTTVNRSGSGGRGGRAPNRGGGRTGPRNNAGPSAPARKLALSGVHDLKGDRIPFVMLEAMKKAGMCFNCFNEANPHRADQCTEPKKPFTDGLVDDAGNVVDRQSRQVIEYAAPNQA
jgi:hypothetical protein